MRAPARKSLETERLLLREIQPLDAKALADTAAIRMIEDPFLHHDSRPLASVYVDQAIAERKRVPRRRFELAIVLKEKRKVVGACSLKLVRNVLLEADLGYIVHPEYAGLGIATEAAARLIEFAFRDLKVFRITAHCERSNAASIRVLKKLGLSLVDESEDRLAFARVRPLAIVEPLAEHESVAQPADGNF